MTLDDFFTDYYVPIRLVGRSARTRTLYTASIRGFSEWLMRPATLDDFRDEVVGRYLAALVDRGLKPATINKELSQLGAMWRLAARRKLVDYWPEIRPVPEPEHSPEAWTREELWRLRISCNMQRGQYAGVQANRWWLALHCVLYSTGERISAALQLEWRDIRDDWITFRAETRKGKRKPNVCQLPDYAIEAIGFIREPDRTLVFPWPLTSSYIYQQYKAILARAELDTGCRSMFHRLRRSHATHLKVCGGDPTSSLKHADPATTLRYIDPRQLPSPTQVLPQFGAG